MIRTERELVALAIALIGDTAKLTASERQLARGAAYVTEDRLSELRELIRNGADPLGEAFCRLRSPEIRRAHGATYTPKVIVDAMIAWAADEATPPVRIIDPGAGSGRFLLAAAERFRTAQLVAVEIDPLATLMLRANAATLGFGDRLSVHLSDYRDITLPPADGPTMFVGNPPYVRHHDISPRWKAWLAETARSLGFTASALAGLHVHFFLKTRQLGRPGDFGTFITAAEWLDVNYGSLLRRMLADGLGGTAVHVIDPKVQPFAGSLTTGAITCFRVGRRPEQLTMRAVKSLDELAPLSAGRNVSWTEIEAASRWSPLVRQTPRPRRNEIELGELFRVHRGQVSGCNAVWIAGEAAKGIPKRFLWRTITRARELLEAGDILGTDQHLKFVVDLPPDLDELTATERRAVMPFLTWAKQMGADEGFVATHRRAWWSVGLRQPAPILCTYMARRAPAFVRNGVCARHLNIAHGLYPVEPMSEAQLDAIAHHLRETVSTSAGRTYAGGLVKFEPGEVARLHIPDPASLAVSA